MSFTERSSRDQNHAPRPSESKPSGSSNPQLSHSLTDYYSLVYRMKGSVWGVSASELAREAAALIKSRKGDSHVKVNVLDLGCGAGRDTIFFARLGWTVTAVDINSEPLALLVSEAQKFGLTDRIKVLRGDFNTINLGTNFDVVFSNYSLHFLDKKIREALLRKLKTMTNPGGIHALLAIKDLNEEYVGSLADYRYVQSQELRQIYQDWNIVENYEGLVPDEHPGVPPHEHQVVELVAERPESLQPISLKTRSNPRGFATFLALLSTLLSTLGYLPIQSQIPSLAKVWPGAIFQGVASAAFGGWGVIAMVMAGIVANAVNVGTWTAIVCFIPANFIQSLIPAWYYRRRLRRGGWNRVALCTTDFIAYAVLLPNLCGALLGALALASFHPEAVKTTQFWWTVAHWSASNIPIALILGVPLFYFLMPSLIREGLTVRGWWR